MNQGMAVPIGRKARRMDMKKKAITFLLLVGLIQTAHSVEGAQRGRQGARLEVNDLIPDKSFVGHWQAIEITEEGKPLPNDVVESVQLFVSGDSYIIVLGDMVTELRVRTKGKNMLDLRSLSGVNAGRWVEGLYSIEDEELEIAYSPVGEGRPEKVDHTAGRYLRFRRYEHSGGGRTSMRVENGLGMKFNLILPATFVMGAELNEPARKDEIQHRVTLTKPFYIGIYEVTVGQFKRYVNAMRKQDKDWKTAAEGGVLGMTGGLSTVATGVNQWNPNASWKSPGFQQGDDHPVVFVSWNDAMGFVQWLSKKEGRTYRLPTEAEWEYACRGMTRTAYCWGNNFSDGKGHANLADQSFEEIYSSKMYGGRFDDGYPYTSPVGSFGPNSHGLYDMHGNVFEWVNDKWGLPRFVTTVNPQGAERGKFHLAKGGAWGSRPDQVRAAFRFRAEPDMRFAGLGFRIVMEVE